MCTRGKERLVTLILHELHGLQQHGTVPVETSGRAAVVARCGSVTGPERLALIADAETFELLRAEGASA
jgi:hypothetical protein